MEAVAGWELDDEWRSRGRLASLLYEVMRWLVGVKKEVRSGILEQFYVQVRSAFFTIVVVFFHSVFTSDAHALAVLPDITRFALDKEFACTFVIVTCGSRGWYQIIYSENGVAMMWMPTDDQGGGSKRD